MDPITAVYGVARVLQESGDHVSARDLLLYVGERSQELYTASGPGTCSNAEGDIGGDDCRGPFSSAAARSDCPAVGDVGNVGDRGHRRRRRAAAGLCFPLFRGDLVDSCGGGSSSSVARNMVLPAGLAEVMWRVARASMGARDWGTAIMALRGLATDREREGNRYVFVLFFVIRYILMLAPPYHHPSSSNWTDESYLFFMAGMRQHQVRGRRGTGR